MHVPTEAHCNVANLRKGPRQARIYRHDRVLMRLDSRSGARRESGSEDLPARLSIATHACHFLLLDGHTLEGVSAAKLSSRLVNALCGQSSLSLGSRLSWFTRARVPLWKMSVPSTSTVDAITVPEGFSLHTENTSHILLPNDNGAFLNPVQEFNRDMSVACIRTWGDRMNELKKKQWEENRERKARKQAHKLKRQKSWSRYIVPPRMPKSIFTADDNDAEMSTEPPAGEQPSDTVHDASEHNGKTEASTVPEVLPKPSEW